MFQMPLRAYRHDAGWLLGHTFLEFTHTGRKTGQPYETVAMVLRYDADAREAVICAAWGPDTDWVRNLRAGPAARVRLGRESFTPQHRFLSDDEAFDVAVQFRREYPRRLRLLSTILGWGDLRDDATVRGFIRTHPFVTFRPAEAVNVPDLAALRSRTVIPADYRATTRHRLLRFRRRRRHPHRLGLGADVARLGSLVPPRWGIGLYRPLSGRAALECGGDAHARLRWGDEAVRPGDDPGPVYVLGPAGPAHGPGSTPPPDA
jgi:deazaflavin-dependent oxidoreductase (nitroreductase family)